jgi:hypothetical protein
MVTRLTTLGLIIGRSDCMIAVKAYARERQRKAPTATNLTCSPMDSSVQFDRMFAHADVVLVVDERKFDDKDHILFMCRGFCDTYRSTRSLYKMLWAENAQAWHGSAPAPSRRFLLNSVNFSDLVAPLSQADTCLYGMLLNLPEPELARAYLTKAMTIWQVASPHALALMVFLDVLVDHVRNRAGPDVRLQIVVDRQNWTENRAPKALADDGLLKLSHGRGNVDVLTVANREGPAAQRYLPLLGLVDSEAWAFGRFLSLGEEQPLDQLLGGERKLTDEDWHRMVSPHSTHAELNAYWSTYPKWLRTKRLKWLRPA